MVFCQSPARYLGYESVPQLQVVSGKKASAMTEEPIREYWIRMGDEQVWLERMISTIVRKNSVTASCQTNIPPTPSSEGGL
jgi:hypothetical protein